MRMDLFYHGLCHSVLGNEPEALSEIVRHLFNLGHQRFGWLGGIASLGRHDVAGSTFAPEGMKLLSIRLQRRLIEPLISGFDVSSTQVSKLTAELDDCLLSADDMAMGVEGWRSLEDPFGPWFDEEAA